MRPVAWTLATATAIFGALGVVDSLATPLSADHPRTPALSLDSELRYGFNLPVIFSAGVLLGASLAAAALSQVDEIKPACRRSCALLAGLFAFMSIDELFFIHEQLFHWDWQLFYLPIALAAGFAWGRVLLAMHAWQRPMFLIWIGGAACWLSSQVLEALQWNGSTKAPLFQWLVPGEELLEMSGSILFLIGLLLLRAAAQESARDVAGTPSRVRPRHGELQNMSANLPK